jgi:hypothetical protein
MNEALEGSVVLVYLVGVTMGLLVVAWLLRQLLR